MKIGLLTSYRAQKQFAKEFKTMVAHFEKKGHVVVHSLDTNLDALLALGYVQREEQFMNHYKNLEACDVIFAECSLQSTQVGFGMSYLRSKGKPTVIISKKNISEEYSPKKDVFSNVENLMVTEYTDDTLIEALNEALSYMETRLDKRFTIIFPSHLLVKVEEVAKRKKLPKSVYIRQLIEKDLKESEK